MSPSQADVERLLAYIDEVLGDPRQWNNPAGYPGSLALCLIDSIWSLGLHYNRHVEPVLARYREHRTRSGSDPERDSLHDLLAVFEEVGGAVGFAKKIGTQHKTSTHSGAPLKATATLQAARALTAREIGISTATDLLTVAATDGTAKRAWRSIPGQKSSETGWRYLLLLAGADEVKPDRMICRFVARGLGRPMISAPDAADLVREAARALQVPVRVLDHAIWRWESGRA